MTEWRNDGRTVEVKNRNSLRIRVNADSLERLKQTAKQEEHGVATNRNWAITCLAASTTAGLGLFAACRDAAPEPASAVPPATRAAAAIPSPAAASPAKPRRYRIRAESWITDRFATLNNQGQAAGFTLRQESRNPWPEYLEWIPPVSKGFLLVDGQEVACWHPGSYET